MTFELPELPYEFDALEPEIDAKTMEIHHDKHHATYVAKLNEALQKHPKLQDRAVEELLANNMKIVPEDIKTAVRNHGGGHANHSLFWEIMTPDEDKREFKGEVAEKIEEKWGSFEDFKKEFSDSAIKVFGSGWTWLSINEDGELEIANMSNQDSPLMLGKKPILGLDVWEHAYYLKHQNKRADYVSSWWNVVNWERVNELYLNALE